MKVHEIDAKGTESNEDMGITPSIVERKNALSLRGGADRTNKERSD